MCSENLDKYTTNAIIRKELLMQSKETIWLIWTFFLKWTFSCDQTSGFELTGLFFTLRNEWTHHSIALKTLYPSSFRCELIRLSVGPKIAIKNAPLGGVGAVLVDLQPNKRSDRVGPKSKVVVLFKSYRLNKVWMTREWLVQWKMKGKR